MTLDVDSSGPAGRGHWTPLEPDVATFLDDFDARSAAGDGGAALFAGTFLALDPVRAVSLTPAVLAAALPARRNMFSQAGLGPAGRVDAWQLRLDDRHVLVAANWAAERSDGRPPLGLASTFLLRREDAGYEVVVYLNHQDLAVALATSR